MYPIVHVDATDGGCAGAPSSLGAQASGRRILPSRRRAVSGGQRSVCAAMVGPPTGWRRGGPEDAFAFRSPAEAQQPAGESGAAVAGAAPLRVGIPDPTLDRLTNCPTDR